MGFDRRFTLKVLLHVMALAAALVALILSLQRSDLAAARIIAALAVVGTTMMLIRHVERSNRAMTRFVEALDHDDVAMRFDQHGSGSLAALGRAVNDAMRRFYAGQARLIEDARFWEALTDDVPIALLMIDDLHGVRPINKAGRRLFDRHEGARPADFACYGTALGDHLASPYRIGPDIITLHLADGPQRALVRAAAMTRLGRPMRVVAVQPVQGTLDAVEVGAQGDVVRVLAHEVLNSLTPVVSLAGTAAALLDEERPDIGEARLAVTTLARRAEGLRRFIDSYRAIARLPEPRRRRFAAGPYAEELARLFAVEWTSHSLVLNVEPGLMLDADPDLLAQVLLNLLINAAQATAPPGTGHLRLTIASGPGGGLLIEVEDDGPGVPEALRDEIFLPFFTTRPAGSGIGLNLARRIAVAHGWQIHAETSASGGAVFKLIGSA